VTIIIILGTLIMGIAGGMGNETLFKGEILPQRTNGEMTP